MISIYSHPEYYPPTLNAVNLLAATFEKITIVHRNFPGNRWSFPHNVSLVSVGEPVSPEAAMKKNMMYKIRYFLLYTHLLYKVCAKAASFSLLLYDAYPTLAFRIVRRLVSKPLILWYHNHDVTDPLYMRKYSLTWFALKAERWIFQRLDLFTIPSLERLSYFPEISADKMIYLPNFPSLRTFPMPAKKKMEKVMKLLYQGRLGGNHGFEEIIPLLNRQVNNISLELHLIGNIDPVYKSSLLNLAKQNKVADKFFIHDPLPYEQLVSFTGNFHVGIAIYKKDDAMNSTMGTASNKIFEYAACGLPVLLYDNAHFRANIPGKNWLYFTDTTSDSLLQAFKAISSNYFSASSSARMDFVSELNFEHVFENVGNRLEMSNALA